MYRPATPRVHQIVRERHEEQTTRFHALSVSRAMSMLDDTTRSHLLKRNCNAVERTGQVTYSQESIRQRRACFVISLMFTQAYSTDTTLHQTKALVSRFHSLIRTRDVFSRLLGESKGRIELTGCVMSKEHFQIVKHWLGSRRWRVSANFLSGNDGHLSQPAYIRATVPKRNKLSSSSPPSLSSYLLRRIGYQTG